MLSLPAIVTRAGIPIANSLLSNCRAKFARTVALVCGCACISELIESTMPSRNKCPILDPVAFMGWKHTPDPQFHLRHGSNLRFNSGFPRPRLQTVKCYLTGDSDIRIDSRGWEKRSFRNGTAARGDLLLRQPYQCPSKLGRIRGCETDS